MNDPIKTILQAAIRAPSGDNCQPWRFSIINENEIDLYIVTELAESFFDLDYRATYLSIGAVIENMRLAANYLGFSLRTNYLQDISQDNPVLHINIEKQSSKQKFNNKLYLAMLSRTVNRRPFLPISLKSSTWSELLAINLPPNVSVTTYTTSLEKKKWAKAVRAADIVRWSEQRIHYELFDKIRYTESEAKEKKTGLEIDRLGAGPAARLVMSFLSDWDRYQILKKFGASRLLAAQTGSLVAASSGLLAIWVETDTPMDWIKGGEVTQLLWNRAHMLGLAVQPLPICFYLSRRYQREAMLHYNFKHEKQLQLLTEIIQEFYGENIKNKIGVMLFRIGKAIPMRTVAIRRNLDDFII